MASTDALPKTLKSITETKLKELSKKQAMFESRKAAIYDEASKQQTIEDRVRVLLEGVTRLKGHPDDGLDTTDKEDDVVHRLDSNQTSARHMYWNIRRDLVQKRYDSSISDDRLQQFEEELRRQLDFISAKHEHALFFNRLVTEWLTNPRNPVLDDFSQDDSSDALYEQQKREEAHEQRTHWESLVFNPRKVDRVEIEQYLTDLFGLSRLSQEALKDLRKGVKLFGKELLAKDDAFNIESLKWAVRGVIGNDLLSTEKVDILREFLVNDAVAQEVADVLNVRLAQLESWSWGSEPISLQMRRHLNGKYRVYMDEDILDAIFFHFIGVTWSIKFKELFSNVLRSHAWKQESTKIPKEDLERRKYFLYEENNYRHNNNILGERSQSYFNDHFLCQLPTNTDTMPVYDNMDQTQAAEGKKFIHLKHSLLHLAMTEIWFQKALYGEITVVQSDFRWFGPSLPHTTLLSVLEFFHLPPVWVEFFKRFLEAPMKFEQDGDDAPIQIRRNGTPMSHSISGLLAEVLLFCMDFSVNQHANGMILYRLHDDFWFWGQERNCAEAWSAVSKFCKVMGLEINEEKSGTARLYGGKTQLIGKAEGMSGTDSSSGSSVSSSVDLTALPQGDIRWGFLKLDEKAGRFEIDQALVDVHINELRRQLKACKSVFSWVQAWNTYMARFISNNFGNPALCLGRPHIEMVLSTLKRIESELFATSDGALPAPGSAVDHLRLDITKRYDVSELPDGFFYFPEEYGGLALTNPFVSLIAMREDIKTTPERILREAFIAEEKAYATAKERFEKEGPNRLALSILGSARRGSEDFMSLEEYMRHPESTSCALKTAYRALLEQPSEFSVALTPDLEKAVSTNESVKNLPRDWSYMNSYSKSIVELYHPGMIKKYGSLAAVEDKTLPLGVVKILKREKVRWHSWV